MHRVTEPSVFIYVMPLARHPSFYCHPGGGTTDGFLAGVGSLSSTYETTTENNHATLRGTTVILSGENLVARCRPPRSLSRSDDGCFRTTDASPARERLRQQPRTTMQRLLKTACIGYAIFLTLLLLTANPAHVIGC